MAEAMPRTRYAALHGESWTGLKCVACAPHSVHHCGRPSKPWRAAIGRRSSGAFPYVWVLTKSIGDPDRAQCDNSSSTHFPAADAGPPTGRDRSTDFTAVAE